MIKKALIFSIIFFSTNLFAQNDRVLDGPFTFTLPNLENEQVTFGYENNGPNLGKISILLIFSTWCSYCKQEIPQFQRLYEKYRDNDKISFLALRTFRARETISIEDFVDHYGITFPMVSDFPKESPNYSATARMWKLNYVPETFIYNSLGERVKFDLEATSEYYDTVEAVIEDLLAE